MQRRCIVANDLDALLWRGGRATMSPATKVALLTVMFLEQSMQRGSIGLEAAEHYLKFTRCQCKFGT